MPQLNSLLARIVAGLAVVSAVAVAPMAAQAANSDATGTLTGGSLSNNAPAITPFGMTLSGINQTVTTAVGATTLVDARGTNAGYTVTVAATAPTVEGVAPSQIALLTKQLPRDIVARRHRRAVLRVLALANEAKAQTPSRASE